MHTSLVLVLLMTWDVTGKDRLEMINIPFECNVVEKLEVPVVEYSPGDPALLPHSMHLTINWGGGGHVH